MLSQEHGEWVERRGLDLELVTRLGFNSQTKILDGKRHVAIAIPYRVDGKTINHKYRWFDRSDGVLWTQDSGAKPSLFNQDVLNDRSLTNQHAIITEGEWDCISAIQCGFIRAMSVPNGAGTKLELADELKPKLQNCKKIVLATDADQPGKDLARELARRFGRARCYNVTYPDGCKDLNDVLKKFGPPGVCKVIDCATPVPIPGLTKLSDYPEIDQVKFYKTPFPSLHGHLRFWHGEFAVITGIPSHGKSRFSLELIAGLNLFHQEPICIMSMEMPVRPYVRDVLHEHYHGIRRQVMTKEQREEADIWMQRDVCFLDPDAAAEAENANLQWVITTAGDAVFRHGIRFLLIDPWNQIAHERWKGESETDYHLRAIRALKTFARTYEVTTLVVAHPAKSVLRPDGKFRKPTLYDIAGSAHWYNAADHGILVWADDVRSTTRTIEVQKSRYAEAGLTGSVQLQLIGKLRDMVEPAKTDSGRDYDFDA